MRLGMFFLGSLLVISSPAFSQDRIPRYCKTDAGVLGPYPNDGSVRVGDSCFGTKSGKRYEGVAVMSRDDEGGGRSGDGKGVPRYCKTDAGVLGPYPNDGSVKVGDSCFGTKGGKRYEGVAVMSRDDDGGGGRSNDDGKGVPRYCKTDAGVLGPYPNDGSVKVGDSCFGTMGGRRYEGIAVMSPDR